MDNTSQTKQRPKRDKVRPTPPLPGERGLPPACPDVKLKDVKHGESRAWSIVEGTIDKGFRSPYLGICVLIVMSLGLAVGVLILVVAGVSCLGK